MIGKVTGTFIQKNRNGENNVRMLQVEITDSDDVQEVEYYAPSGDDSPPVNDSLVRIIDLGDNWKIAIACNDNVEPSANQGEKILYSNDGNGNKKAKHKFGTDEVHTFNDGSKQAARLDDTIQLNMSGVDIQALAAALLTTGAFTPTGSPPAPASSPVTFTDGKITQGTDKILLP